MKHATRRQFLIGTTALALASQVKAQTTYSSTLVNGYTPHYPLWNGVAWTAAMGSVYYPNLDYAWRVDGKRNRFEIRNTPYDRPADDPTTKRRSELHYKKGNLSNGLEYWGAYSFIDHAWSDPAGMLKTTGGAHFQMHMPSGGSPAFAFRRAKDGQFWITTNPDGNVTRLKMPLSFGVIHDLVYRCICHPTSGQLDVWVNGRQVLAFRGPMGVTSNGYYHCHGLYYGGGVTCPIVAEFSNIALPTRSSLAARVGSRPAW